MVLIPLAVILAMALAIVKPITGLLLALVALTLLVVFTPVQVSFCLLVFSMLLSPEVPFGDLIGQGVGKRPVTMRLEDLLLPLIGIAWFAKTIKNRELPLVRRTLLNRPILYYMLAGICSTLIGTLTGDVKPMVGFFFLLKYFEYFFLFFMVVNHITRNDQVVSLCVALLLTTFFVSLYSISQIPSGERATAPFEGLVGEPNTLGGYLVFMMAIVVGLLLYIESFQVRVALFVLLGCILLGLFPTFSRSSYIAGGVLALSILFTQWRRPGVVATVTGIVIVLVLMAPISVKERMLHTFTQPQQVGQVIVGDIRIDTSTSDRLKAWNRSLRVWWNRPLLGHGVASVWWADAQYVKVLVETGLLGMVSFIFIIVRLWKGARKSFLTVQSRFHKGLSYGFLLGLVSMLVHAIGANTFTIVRIMEPFWLLAGLVVLLPTLQHKVGESIQSHTSVQAAA